MRAGVQRPFVEAYPCDVSGHARAEFDAEFHRIRVIHGDDRGSSCGTEY